MIFPSQNITVLSEQSDRTRSGENSGNENYKNDHEINNESDPYDTGSNALRNYDYEGESGEGYGEGEEGSEAYGFKNKKVRVNAKRMTRKKGDRDFTLQRFSRKNKHTAEKLIK